MSRHVLLDKRAEMPACWASTGSAYQVSEIELVANFRFKRGDGDGPVDEELITKVVARELGLPYAHLDPLQLDYKLVTETFGGPFAERHLVIALENTPRCSGSPVPGPGTPSCWRALADPVMGSPSEAVMAQKAHAAGVIVREFHGFLRSMRAAEVEFAASCPISATSSSSTSSRKPATSTRSRTSPSSGRSGTC